MTVKMVVPTLGSLEVSKGVLMGSQFVVVDVSGHGARDQMALQAAADQLGKLVDKIAQVCAAFEGNTGHVLAKS